MTDDPLLGLGSLSSRAAGRRVVRRLPARPGETGAWPDGTPEALLERLATHGITAPWSHQAQAAAAALSGEHVVIATGTSSGKTLAMWLPSLSALLADPRACVLYLSPTKALAHDQLAALNELYATQKAAPPQFTPAPPKVAEPEPKAGPKAKKQPAPVQAPSGPRMPADPSLAALTLVCSTILASDAAVTSR